MALTVDEILEDVGPFGCYQISLAVLLGFLSFVPAFQELIGTFIAAEPGWRCVANSTVCNINGTITENSPEVDYTYRCHIPRSEWEFTSPYNYTSVITEWDLVCDQAIYATFATSLVLIGVLPGSLMFGYVADKYGRKPALLISMYLTTFASGGSSFAPKYWIFAVLRFITGYGVGGALLVLPNLPLEYTGIKHRGTASSIAQSFWSFGLMLLVLLAYYIREWRTLNLVCAAFGLPVIFLWRCIPESIRFHVLVGKTEKALNNIRKVARCNGRKVSNERIDIHIAGQPNNAVRSPNICFMFKTCKLAGQTLIQWFIWAVTAMIYYAVAIGSSTLGGNMYLDFFLSSLTEVPGSIIVIIIVSRVRRKTLIVGGLFSASIATAVCSIAFPPDDTSTAMTVGRITMALISKFFISPTFGILFLFSAELLPTSVRSIGLGACSAAARIGSFSAPYVLFLGQYWNVLPYGIMAVCSLIAGLLCLTLPETHMKPTKEVFENEQEKAASNETEVVVDDRNPLIVNSYETEPTRGS